MKSSTKRLVASGFAIGMAFVLFNSLGLRMADAKSSLRTGSAGSSTAATNATIPIQTPVPISVPVAVPTFQTNLENIAELDAHRQLALGMIETGNNDNEIGGAGEISRYQIMPSVWKHYSQSSHYQNPDISLAVAQQHWSQLYASFKQQAHREPSDFDMYVLWNTRYGYYASKAFNPARLSPVVRDRAQRFVNLVQRSEL